MSLGERSKTVLVGDFRAPEQRRILSECTEMVDDDQLA